MAMTRVTAGNEASIDDLNQLIDLLQGTSGFTESFLLRCAASSDFKIRLADAAGARRFEIQDSAGTAVAYIDSDGNLTVTGGVVVPTSASPSQTTEGSLAWDSDDDVLTAGTGAATKRLGLTRGAGSNASATAEIVYDTTAGALKVWDGSASQTVSAVKLVGSSSAATSTTSTSAVDLVTISSLSIAATDFVESMFNLRKTAAAANFVAYGLKVNSTVVVEAAALTTSLAWSTTTQEVQDGVCHFIMAPRRSNYQGGLQSTVTVHTTTTSRVMAVATALLANPIPAATITSMAIRAINDTASNAAEITDWKIWTR